MPFSIGTTPADYHLLSQYMSLCSKRKNIVTWWGENSLHKEKGCKCFLVKVYSLGGVYIIFVEVVYIFSLVAVYSFLFGAVNILFL